MANSSKTPFLVAGLALAGLAGYMYLKSNQKINKIDLGAGSGSNGIGGSGEFYNTPGVASVDSVATGIEDNVPSVGVVDASDSGSIIAPNDVVDNLDEPLLSSSDITSLAPYVGLAGSGYVANKIIKRNAGRPPASGTGFLSKLRKGGLRVARGVSRAVPIAGTVLLVADGIDMFVGRAGDGGYTGEPYDPSNTVIADFVNEQMSGIPSNAVTPSADVKNNVGNLNSPVKNVKNQNSLNYIAGTQGDTWKLTYYAEKTGASASKGSTTSTYKSSSGAQVALAGISPSEYASYLKSKGK